MEYGVLLCKQSRDGHGLLMNSSNLVPKQWTTLFTWMCVLYILLLFSVHGGWFGPLRSGGFAQLVHDRLGVNPAFAGCDF